MHKVFVYGTLRTGQPNWSWALTGKNGHSELLGSHVTDDNYTMLHLGGFPGVVAQGDSQVVGEVYEVDDVVFSDLDRLEGYPNFYDRQLIDTPYGEAWIYLLPVEELDYHTEIPSGDWLNP